MKILILTTDTGGGHNAAAKALREEITGRGDECIIKDCLSFIPKAARKGITSGHVFAYRYTPRIYGKFYDMQTRHDNKAVFNVLEPYVSRLWKYISYEGMDCVISVHVFGAVMMTVLRKKNKFAIPSFFVATDYTCSPAVNMLDVDRFFIPAGTGDIFTAAGIDGARLEETGIPVSKAFYAPFDRKEEKRRLGLDPERKIAVLSAGSMGCSFIRKLAIMISKTDRDVTVAVLCGSNKSMYKQISGCRKKESIIPVPFTKEMDRWMKAADVFVTKAGGITTTEAATVHVPLVLINAVPGLETHNIDFFVKNRLAETADSNQEAVGIVKTLFSIDAEECRMVKNQKKMFRRSSSAAIIDTVTGYGQ